MKFSAKYFFVTCEQIRRKLRICSHILQKSLTESFTVCAVVFIILILPRNAAPSKVSFQLAEHLTKLGDLKDVDIPRQHKFIMSDVRQSMGVFSETAPGNLF